jgi:hypothetical protein
MFIEPEQADHQLEAGSWRFSPDTVRRKPSRTANVKERFQP